MATFISWKRSDLSSKLCLSTILLIDKKDSDSILLAIFALTQLMVYCMIGPLNCSVVVPLCLDYQDYRYWPPG